MRVAESRPLTRRAAVTHLGLGGIAAILAARGHNALAAQDASPEATPGAIPPLLVEWADAWTSGDPERLLALYAEDAVYEEKPTASVSRGHDEIREFYEATHAGFPNIRVTPRNGFQAEEFAFLEGDFAGESADGQPFSVPFVVVMELEGDKIRRSADYFDLNSVLTQIGAAPEAATPTG